MPIGPFGLNGLLEAGLAGKGLARWLAATKLTKTKVSFALTN